MLAYGFDFISWDSLGGFWGILVLSAIITTLRQVAASADKKEESQDAAFWSKRAEGILEDLLAGRKTETFLLFLRPFRVDSLSTTNPDKSLIPYLPSSSLPDYVPWERILLAELRAERVPVLALGHRTVSGGAARVEVEDLNWQRVFSLLAASCEAVLIVPALTDGLMWELKWFAANGGMDRCVLLMLGQGPTAGQAWASLQSAVKTVGVTLPAWRPGGAAVRVNEKGEILDEITPFSPSKSGHRRELTDLLMKIGAGRLPSGRERMLGPDQVSPSQGSGR